MLPFSRSKSVARRYLPAACIALVLVASGLTIPRSQSQVAARGVSIDSLTPLIAKLKQQQLDLAANQTKIEAQTAALKEELRQARIYSARGGGGVRR